MFRRISSVFLFIVSFSCVSKQLIKANFITAHFTFYHCTFYFYHCTNWLSLHTKIRFDIQYTRQIKNHILPGPLGIAWKINET
jgi:hypothetical protein